MTRSWDFQTKPTLPRNTTESVEIHLSVTRTVAWKKSLGEDLAPKLQTKNMGEKIYTYSYTVLCIYIYICIHIDICMYCRNDINFHWPYAMILITVWKHDWHEFILYIEGCYFATQHSGNARCVPWITRTRARAITKTNTTTTQRKNNKNKNNNMGNKKNKHKKKHNNNNNKNNTNK